MIQNIAMIAGKSGVRTNREKFVYLTEQYCIPLRLTSNPRLVIWNVERLRTDDVAPILELWHVLGHRSTPVWGRVKEHFVKHAGVLRFSRPDLAAFLLACVATMRV